MHFVGSNVNGRPIASLRQYANEAREDRPSHTATILIHYHDHHDMKTWWLLRVLSYMNPYVASTRDLMDDENNNLEDPLDVPRNQRVQENNS